MTTEVSIQAERVDDLPLLVWQQRAMGIPQIIDEIIQPHGNRQGLSVGWTVVGWLSYILSQADHRLGYVGSWAAEHLTTLQALLPVEVTVRDFTDDRLGDVLNYLSQTQYGRPSRSSWASRSLRSMHCRSNEPMWTAPVLRSITSQMASHCYSTG